MEIKSAHSSSCLRFSDLRGDEFFAALKNPEYSGIVRIWLYKDAKELVGLFESMAENWRGWTGAKEWSSMESEFAMTCTCDKLGHITLAVEMCHDFGSEEPWRLRASLVVDAGQLEAIARDAKLFFQT